jgi:hypothetical protein
MAHDSADPPSREAATPCARNRRAPLRVADVEKGAKVGMQVSRQRPASHRRRLMGPQRELGRKKLRRRARNIVSRRRLLLGPRNPQRREPSRRQAEHMRTGSQSGAHSVKKCRLRPAPGEHQRRQLHFESLSGRHRPTNSIRQVPSSRLGLVVFDEGDRGRS